MFSSQYFSKVEEYNIAVPWGHIACKWWGPKTICPILCIHGWQDNSGSFDPLIVQLPNHISYLAVDLPGHGRSSRIPDGMIYTVDVFFYAVLLICDHFRWDRVSLMGHSLGAIISFLYASAFPEKCDMVIALDNLRPYANVFKMIHRYFWKALPKSMKADVRNREPQEPPSYEFNELLIKIKSGLFIEICEEAAPYVLERSVMPSANQPNKYYFTRDSRLKSLPVPMMAHDMATMYAKQITSPYCFLRSSVVPNFESEEFYNEIVEIMRRNPKFEMHSVGGNHHVHLNEPDKVSGLIATFIDKHRPIGQVLSRL